MKYEIKEREKKKYVVKIIFIAWKKMEKKKGDL